VDTSRVDRVNARAQAWILHNFEISAAEPARRPYRSRVMLADFDCAGGRWTLRHLATYSETCGRGNRLSADDFAPTEADYRLAVPGTIMDKVRLAVCR
jgi:hypothetical protein